MWEEAELRKRLTSHENGGRPLHENFEKFVELLKSPLLLFKQADQHRKRELLRILLSNLSVSGKNVSVVLKIPFSLIAEREKTSDGGPSRGTCRTTDQLFQQLLRHFADQPVY